MIIACLGDSLTEGDYGVFGKSGIANVHKENYPYFLSKIMDCEVRNFGRCGFNSILYLDIYKKGEADITGADIVLLMLGTNGKLDLSEDIEGNHDYKELCDLIRRDAPDARLILCTPPHVTENPEFSNCGYAGQVKKAVDFVRHFAKAEGLPVIETALCPDFTAENEHIYQANDGLHFVEAGYKVLAQYIAGELKKMT